jgi:hypothetical protein
MQKVYLLLRNNQQTGPHSLEELLQLGLKSFDLIWVEGKSYGWSYPSEVETLKPFVTANSSSEKPEIVPAQQPTPEFILPKTTEPASTKKIFVSLPSGNAAASAFRPAHSVQDPIEQKAEALRKKIQSYSHQGPAQQEEVKTNYTRSLADVEEDYTSWIYRKKTKRKKPVNYKYWMAAGIIGLALAGTWLMAKTVYKEPAAKTQQLLVQNQNRQPLSEPVDETEGALTTVVTTENKLSKQPGTTAVTRETKKKSTPPAGTKKAAPLTTSAAEVVKQGALPPIENPPVVTEEKNEPVAAETPKEKKKSLKQILGGLFRKNKKDETVQDEPKPADRNTNERNATRRDEQSSAETVTVDLADQVDIKTNKSADEWMMGVQGLKLTLYNRSSTALQSAVVEVLYYSEQNNLLDKKTVYFSNVASKKSQTVAAPDHRMADHVEYKVVSAKGTENAYAKQ